MPFVGWRSPQQPRSRTTANCIERRNAGGGPGVSVRRGAHQVGNRPPWGSREGANNILHLLVAKGRYMILDLPIGELVWLASAVVLAGIVTGIVAGLFGIGGGAVIVPVLFEMFGFLGVSDSVRMQLCVGTSLAIIVPTTLRSYLAHRAKGLVLPDVIRLWTLPAVVGAVIGSLAAAYAPGSLFKIAFMLFAALVATKLFVGGDRWVIAAALPGRPAMIAYGLSVGLASSLMGVSGGSLSTIVLTLYGTPIHNAVATSAGLGVPITVVGTIGYMLAGLKYQPELPWLSLGFVSLLGVAVMAPVSSLVAPWGARLAHRLPKRQLEIGFGLFLVATSIRFLVSLM